MICISLIVLAASIKMIAPHAVKFDCYVSHKDDGMPSTTPAASIFYDSHGTMMIGSHIVCSLATMLTKPIE
jgi:hypothetical protein